MKVAGIEVGDRPLILAPMEDVTNPPFRKFCKKYGADWLYSEFVSADALVRSVNKSLKKLTIDETERPVTIQIYGRFIDSMVEAAKIVEEVRPDFIDINFGCPVKRVAQKGAGAGMLKDIPLMVEMTRQIVQAVKIPVTAKTRLGGIVSISLSKTLLNVCRMWGFRLWLFMGVPVSDVFRRSRLGTDCPGKK